MSKREKEVIAPANEERFVTIPTETNPITVGTIPMDKLVRRRSNFRKMTQQQKAALQASINASGMQSFIAVVKNDDGTYGIVDGHHRMEELQSRGVKSVPVIVLPNDTSKKAADLAMLSFNVSAEIVDDEFSKLLIDLLESGVDKNEVATAAVVSGGFLDRLQEALNLPTPEASPDDDLAREGLKEAAKGKGKKAPKIKVLVLIGTEEGSGIQGFAATHADVVISKEIRDVLRESGLELDEVSPIWVESDMDLVEKLAEMSETEGE